MRTRLFSGFIVFVAAVMGMSCDVDFGSPSNASRNGNQPIVAHPKADNDPECHGEFLSFNSQARRIDGDYPNVQFDVNWTIWCDYGGIYGYTFDVERLSPSPASILVNEFSPTIQPCEPCYYEKSFVVAIDDPNPKMAETYRIRVAQTWLDGTVDWSNWIEFSL